jgi:hypothetical protein
LYGESIPPGYHCAITETGDTITATSHFKILQWLDVGAFYCDWPVTTRFADVRRL